METCHRERDGPLRNGGTGISAVFLKVLKVSVDHENEQCSIFQEDINQSEDTWSHTINTWTLDVQHSKSQTVVWVKEGLCV